MLSGYTLIKYYMYLYFADDNLFSVEIRLVLMNGLFKFYEPAQDIFVLL